MLRSACPLAAAALLISFMPGCGENPAEGVDEAKVGEKVAPADAAADANTAADAAVDHKPARITTYVFTENSKIGFVGAKVTGKHEGGFERFDGAFSVADDERLADGKHVVTIDMTSTWSDSDKLTQHLKSADFFAVEQFPEAKFELDSAKELDDGRYELSGQLTLHGVTRTISFPAELNVTDEKIELDAEFWINRFDFGVKYAGKADDLIKPEVVIRLDLEAVPVGNAPENA